MRCTARSHSVPLAARSSLPRAAKARPRLLRLRCLLAGCARANLCALRIYHRWSARWRASQRFVYIEQRVRACCKDAHEAAGQPQKPLHGTKLRSHSKRLRALPLLGMSYPRSDHAIAAGRDEGGSRDSDDVDDCCSVPGEQAQQTCTREMSGVRKLPSSAQFRLLAKHAGV